jgi:hypothetical protein
MGHGRAATRRRWVVLAVSVEVGVGVALIATTAGDSSRPLRDILVGLFLGLLLGLSALEPVSSGLPWTRAVARHGAGRRRLAPQRARRAAQRGARASQPDIVHFASVTWPEPQLSESPAPTFPAPPRH